MSSQFCNDVCYADWVCLAMTFLVKVDKGTINMCAKFGDQKMFSLAVMKMEKSNSNDATRTRISALGQLKKVVRKMFLTTSSDFNIRLSEN